MAAEARTPRRFRYIIPWLLAVVAAMLLVILMGAGGSSATSNIMGDANCDGAITIMDSSSVLAAAGLGTQTPCSNLADVNCDGDVVFVDAFIILQSVAGFTQTVEAGCPIIGEAVSTTPAITNGTSPTTPPTSIPTATPTPNATATPTSGPTYTPGAGQMPPLPQRWVGVNVWGLAASNSVYSCGSAGGNHGQFLDTTFTEMRSAGIDVVRFWAFQAYAMSLSNGSRDWSALDAVFQNALEHGVYLVPVLDNYWKDCNYWPITLYPNGQRHQGYPLSQPQWIQEIVNRYSGHPALLLWEVVNEPEANSHSTSDVLAFQQEMAGLVSAVKAEDPNTPVSLGNLGNGQYGFSNTNYKATFLASGADWMTAHDYQDWNVPIPWPNSCDWNSMCSDLEDSKDLGVPFYIGETGSDGCDNSSKANALRNKIEAYHAAGAVGIIYWAFDIRANPGNCGYDIGPDGATAAVFGDY